MNLFQPCVRLVEDEQLASDKKQLKDACAFLLEVQVPGLVKDLLEHAIFITDGVTLCETMHSRGINIRYLGYLVQQIAEHETLSYIHVGFFCFYFCWSLLQIFGCKSLNILSVHFFKSSNT